MYQAYRREIEHAFSVLRERLAQGRPKDSEDFDLRGELYRLALEIAPHARDRDLAVMSEWITPRPKERFIDLAAGTGFLTLPLARLTEAPCWAIDPSERQIAILGERAVDQHLAVYALCGRLDGSLLPEPLETIIDSLDFVTSFGGLHHMADHQLVFRHVAQLLRPGGRFIAADVSSGTNLAKHFDLFVAEKCLTGHKANWLSPTRIVTLCNAVGLTLIRTEIVDIRWVFDNETQMALFFKGLHAYELSEEEIVQDLKDALGFEKKGGKVYLNWPLMVFEAHKPYE